MGSIIAPILRPAGTSGNAVVFGFQTGKARIAATHKTPAVNGRIVKIYPTTCCGSCRPRGAPQARHPSETGREPETGRSASGAAVSRPGGVKREQHHGPAACRRRPEGGFWQRTILH